MSSKHHILFDLDGTLTDSFKGIVHSVQYALSRYGIVENDLHKLTPFIGPPLTYSFREFYHFSDAQADEAVRYYCEYFWHSCISPWQYNHVIQRLWTL